jgi:hypothetical protein
VSTTECPASSAITQGTPCTSAYASMTCAGTFGACCDKPTTTNCVCGGYSGPNETPALPEAGSPLVWECMAVSCAVCGPGTGSDAGPTADGSVAPRVPTCPDASTVAPGAPCSSTYSGVMCWGISSACPCEAPTMTDCTCGAYDGSSKATQWACDTVTCNTVCDGGAGRDAAPAKDAGQDAGPPTCPPVSTISQGTACGSTYVGMTCSGQIADCPCGGAESCFCVKGSSGSGSAAWVCPSGSCSTGCGSGGGGDAGSGKDAGAGSGGSRSGSGSGS